MSGFEFERPPVRPDPVALARLEHSHKEAVQAGIDLREQWKQEDAATAEARRFIWQAHEQGARDRDALRVKLGGRSLIEADAEAAREAAAARLKAADDAQAALMKEAADKAESQIADAEANAKAATDRAGIAAASAIAKDKAAK